MKKLFNFIFILFLISSCTVTPGHYSTDYSYSTSPQVTVVTPTPIYNPYFYNPYFFRPRIWTSPNPRCGTWSYNPRPRTTTVIVNTNTGYHHNHSGPRGGRRK